MALFTETIEEGEKVNGEDQGPKERALGHTGSDSGGLRFKDSKQIELSKTEKVGF